MNNEEKILSMLETLIQGQTELRESQAVLEHEMGELKSAQFRTHVNQEKHSREQAVMQSDIKAIKTEVKDLHMLSEGAFSDILRLDKRFEKLQSVN